MCQVNTNENAQGTSHSQSRSLLMLRLGLTGPTHGIAQGTSHLNTAYLELDHSLVDRAGRAQLVAPARHAAPLRRVQRAQAAAAQVARVRRSGACTVGV